MKAIHEPPPVGWHDYQYEDRIIQLKKLPHRVRVMLAAEFHPHYSRKDVRTCYSAGYAANAAYESARGHPDAWKHLYHLYRHTLGPTGLVFDPAWRTSTVVALAREISESRDFNAMPILADALQDAGCDNAELMHHLQNDSEEWTLADWSLWNALGYEEEQK